VTSLNSLPLWGTLAALGISIPIVLHILNKARPKKVNWAAMELLQKTTQQQSKKIKLEDWLLMVLRCLTFLLVALAMMRLVFVNSSDLFSGASRELILVIDSSYSMNHGQYESRFDLAKKKAMKIVNSLPSGSKISLVTIGDEPEVLIRHRDPSEISLERYFAALEAKPEGFGLEVSLSVLDELLNESDSANREVIFLTDAQKRSWCENSESAIEKIAELNQKASISLLPLGDESYENLALSDFHMTSGACRSGGFINLSAKIINHGESLATASIELFHNSNIVDVTSVSSLQPKEERLLRFGVQLESSGPNKFQLSLESDNLEDDNSAYLAIDVPDKLKVLIVEGSPGAGRYLELATQLERSGYAEGLICTVSLASLVSAEQIEKNDVVVLADVGDLDEENIKILDEKVRNGAGLLVYAGVNMDAFSAEQIIGRLVTMDWEKRVSPEDGRDHQIRVSPQSDQLGLELRRLEAEILDCKVNGFHQVQTAADSKILLELDNGNPLLFIQEVERGKLAIFTTGADREWSSLPLNPAGPILFHLLLQELSTGDRQKSLRIGESARVEIRSNRLGAEPKLIGPSGEVSVPVRQEARESNKYIELLLSKTEIPGFHELQFGDNTDFEVLAANLDAGESDLKPATIDELESVFENTGVKILGSESMVDNSENQTHLGSFLALAALFAFIGQAAFSTELTRRKQKSAPAIRTGFGVGVKN
jgi:hypothetical protein|tara:strand:- start:3459 stop:5597 length:2139 start_codon:yes stop_codon:yes gene_type:complete